MSSKRKTRLFCFPPRSMRILLPWISVLQNHDDFVRGNRTLAQNLPAARSQREIDNRGGQRMRRGPAMDDQRNAVADLVAYAGGVGALAGAGRFAAVAVTGRPN